MKTLLISLLVLGLVGCGGAQGPQGPAGLNGTNGLPGAKGDTGAIGPQGSQGPQGNAGSNGTNGAVPVHGLNCSLADSTIGSVTTTYNYTAVLFSDGSAFVEASLNNSVQDVNASTFYTSTQSASNHDPISLTANFPAANNTWSFTPNGPLLAAPPAAAATTIAIQNNSNNLSISISNNCSVF